MLLRPFEIASILVAVFSSNQATKSDGHAIWCKFIKYDWVDCAVRVIRGQTTSELPLAGEEAMRKLEEAPGS